MNRNLYHTLSSWPKSYITDADLAVVINKSDSARYGLVNRALKDGHITTVRRGLYLICTPQHQPTVDLFEIAQMIYGPSFISLESALQYHQLIPEAIYEVTSVAVKRSQEFSTPLGLFSYSKIPLENFLLGVSRVELISGSFFIATPWRAIADLFYLKQKKWTDVDGMCEDLRMEREDLVAFDMTPLRELADEYPNGRTRAMLKSFVGVLR